MTDLIQEYIKGLKVSDRILEEMVKSRKKVDATFEPNFDLTFIFDKECKYLFVNFMAANVIGIRPVDMEGKHWRQISITSEIMEKIEETVKHVLTTQEVIIINLKFKDTRTFEMRYHESTFSPLYNYQGHCTAVYNISKDVTEQVRTEEKLFRQTQLFTQIIEKAPQAITVIDSQGKILYCNSAAKDLFEISVDPLVGKSISLISDKLGVGNENLAIVRTIKKKAIIEEHKRVLGKDLLVNSFPLFDNNGDVLWGASVIQDISQTLVIQEELRKLDRFNLVGQMAGGVAHEIRNPLTVIKGYLQFLSRKVPAEVDEQFQIVLAEVSRIEAILSDFLGIAGSTQTERKMHDLNQIFLDLLPLIKTDAVKHNIELKFELADEMPQLLLNEKELKQVILNLSRNGIEAMPEKGLLSVKTLNEPNKILFVITDNGVGIPKEAIANIFNPFYTTKQGGTGLGLAICENIVRNHKGKIEVYSGEGQGSSFVVYFPKMPARM